MGAKIPLTGKIVKETFNVPGGEAWIRATL
jgi:hypothetical protein